MIVTGKHLMWTCESCGRFGPVVVVSFGQGEMNRFCICAGCLR